MTRTPADLLGRDLAPTRRSGRAPLTSPRGAACRWVSSPACRDPGHPTGRRPAQQWQAARAAPATPGMVVAERRQRTATLPLGTDAERLSTQQERGLVISAGAGDADACRQLVEAFRPAILGLARSFHRASGVEWQDLVQEGVAGLLVAARRYDTGLDTPFWAYASFWVRKAMQELVADLTRPVALSDRAVRALAAIRTARQEHVQLLGIEPTTEEVMRATGLSRAQLESLQAADRPARSIEDRWVGTAAPRNGRRPDRRSRGGSSVRAGAGRHRDP